MVAERKNAPQSKPRRPPATTPEARENQLISLAVDLAERQLAEGTASSQVITHFLKLATTREQLERDKLRHETALLQARSESMASSQRSEEIYAKALEAMRSYKGQQSPDEDYYED